ncbi:hypothetical protein NQ318_012451 [Aromia moschata]|uniref:Kinesin motor domain-containing protein n=1 Tax=Aromia moschata TaxID=1265417 RepID=A0AAV8XI40_9CUCU|nr:hypothetical protein NQ318_012451 [Aromia moschata]
MSFPNHTTDASLIINNSYSTKMSKPASNNVRVFYRIYPMEKTEWGHLKLEDKTILMRHLQELSSLNHKVKPPTFWEFKADGIFYNNDQQYVYVNVIDGVLDRVVEGNNAIIIAFGQTRTGKTITLGGLQLSEEDFGITPRVIYDLFKLKSELPKNVKMCIQISCTEFSNTTAADLLKDYPFFVNYYRCRESTKIKVRSEYEALKVIFKGEGRKSFAFNSEYLSNLCSTVVTFHITTADTDFSSPRKVQSRLHIIDMAGVDTVGNTSSIYKYPPDIGKANIIKTNLEQFVLTLKKNVPFYTRLKERTNPLIYYLGNDLSNESIFSENSMITISMLRFGQLVRGLKPKQKEIVSQVNENVQVQYLQNKLEKLEQQNVHNSVLLNQDLTQDMNKDRLEHVQKIIKEYLRDRVNEITVLNVAEAAEVFKVFKQICIERVRKK